MQMEESIGWGAVVAAVIALWGGIKMIFGMKAKVESHERRLKGVEHEVKCRFQEVRADMKVMADKMDARYDKIDSKLDRLWERGQ